MLRTNFCALAMKLARSLLNANQHAVELNQLTELGHLLQSCLSEEEAYELIAAAIQKLLPEYSGSLYRVRPDNQRAIAIREWGTASPVEKAFEPNQCWAIRRGRGTTGRASTGTLCALDGTPVAVPG
jgi:GAF domain-containing protein